MKEIRDSKVIRTWLEKKHISDFFDTPGLSFQAYRYEKGEYISSPHKPLHKLLFLVKGTIQIYGIRPDGTMAPINQVQDQALIGDIEFTNQGYSPFFCEAKTTAVFLALPTEKYRPQLDQDLRFLHLLLEQFTDKLRLFSLEATSATVEERLLLYLKTGRPQGEIHGLEAATLRLRCSRRQLQRALRHLLEEGTLEKLGKGHYRLTGGEGD